MFGLPIRMPTVAGSKGHVVQLIPDLGVGGAERMLCNLVRELCSTHRVTVVSLWPPIAGSPVESNLIESGAEVVHLHKRPGVDPAIFTKLARALHSLAPAVVHSHRMAVRYVLPWMALHHGVRHVHTVHTLAQHEGTRLDQALLGAAYRAGRIVPVACGPLVADSVRRHYGVDPRLVDNGVGPEFFELRDPPDQGSALELVCVARLAEVKNHDMLLRAVAAARATGADVRLKLVGDGPLRAELEERVVTLGLSQEVTFLGQTSDVPRVLRDASVSVLTSHYEGAPLSVMEAMAVGTPVLANAVGGLPYLIREGGGWLFDGSLRDLTHTLIRLSKQPDEVARMAGAGRSVAAQRYSATAMASGYRKIYAEGNWRHLARKGYCGT